MKKLMILGVILSLGTAAFAQLPQPIDSAVIHTPGMLDRVIRTALLRMPLIQYQDFSITGKSGIDSTLVTFPEPFADSLFAFSVQVADTIDPAISNLGQSLQAILVYGATPRSNQTLLVMVDRITIDSTLNFTAIAVGRRP